MFRFGNSSVRTTVIEIGAYIKVVKSQRVGDFGGHNLDEEVLNLLKTRLREKYPALFNEQGETEYDKFLRRKAKDIRTRLS